MSKTLLLVAALCAVLVAAVGATSAFAGEITGNGKPKWTNTITDPVTGEVSHTLHGQSACAFSGQEDDQFLGGPRRGQPFAVVGPDRPECERRTWRCPWHRVQPDQGRDNRAVVRPLSRPLEPVQGSTRLQAGWGVIEQHDRLQLAALRPTPLLPGNSRSSRTNPGERPFDARAVPASRPCSTRSTSPSFEGTSSDRASFAARKHLPR